MDISIWKRGDDGGTRMLANNEEVNRLLILGNGFDLDSKLQSSFMNFLGQDKQINSLALAMDKIINNKVGSLNDSFLRNLNYWQLEKKDTFDWMPYLVEDIREEDYKPFVTFGATPEQIDDLPIFYKLNYWYRKLFPNDDLRKLITDIGKKGPVNFIKIIAVATKYVSSHDNTDWSDIENMLEKALIFSDKYELNKSVKPEFDDMRSTETKDDERIVKTYFFLARLLSNLGQTGETYLDYIERNLREFEESFKKYMAKQVKKGGEAFVARSSQRCENISEDENTNILTFNYTPITVGRGTKNNYGNIVNIHGRIDSKIIIGIDQKETSPKSDIFRFTKTFRIMSEMNGSMTTTILDGSITTIAFFGHSLNSSDYSYFQSIFDYLDIYNNPITLKFFYVQFNLDEGETWNENAVRRKKEMAEKVSRLLYDYGNTLDNEEHGHNLVHKLLLEKRLQLVQLERRK